MTDEIETTDFDVAPADRYCGGCADFGGTDRPHNDGCPWRPFSPDAEDGCEECEREGALCASCGWSAH
jgi:hypothetical protein